VVQVDNVRKRRSGNGKGLDQVPRRWLLEWHLPLSGDLGSSLPSHRAGHRPFWAATSALHRSALAPPVDPRRRASRWPAGGSHSSRADAAHSHVERRRAGPEIAPGD